MVATKYTQFSDWINQCVDYGLRIENIKEQYNEYCFKKDDCVVAYWDRQQHIGYICIYDIEE